MGVVERAAGRALGAGVLDAGAGVEGGRGAEKVDLDLGFCCSAGGGEGVGGATTAKGDAVEEKAENGEE